MGLKVNFSKDEAESKAREIVPSGEYHCKVVEVEQKDVKPPSLNVGKPYWAVQFVIQTDKYAGNRLFANIMLFEGKDGTLGSLSQFLKALGYDVTPGEFELPEADDLIGRDLNVKGNKIPAGFNKKAGRDLPERFNVTGYKPANVTVKTGNSSLLP
jgi:hypothetical protein